MRFNKKRRKKSLFYKSFIIYLAGLIISGGFNYGFTQEEYLLRPGDQVVISVLGQPEFTRSLVIPPSRMISYPLVGEIEIEEMSTTQLAKKITEKLKDFIPYPQVTVELEKYRIEKVYILGEIVRPGEYPIKEGEKGIKIIEVLARAGGPTKVANLKKAKIIRAGGKIEVIDIRESWKVPGVSAKMLLFPDETLFIPRAIGIDWRTFLNIAMTISYLVSTGYLITR